MVMGGKKKKGGDGEWNWEDAEDAKVREANLKYCLWGWCLSVGLHWIGTPGWAEKQFLLLH